jgi:hypothetical protein
MCKGVKKCINPKNPSKKIINGNNTKNHDRAVNPFLHNHPNTYVHIIAKNNFIATAKNGIPLIRDIIQKRTVTTK